MCQIATEFIKNKKARKTSDNAVSASEIIRTHLRDHLSTNAPAKGAKKMVGSIAIIVPIAKTDAEPEERVRYHTSENWTRVLPNREKA